MNRVQPEDAEGSGGEPWVPTGLISRSGTHYILRKSNSLMHASPLVVFIHGINYWHVHFNKMATYLHEELGYATLQYDNLGMGFTSLHPSESRRDETWKGKGHVRQLYDLLRELNMLRPPLFLIGHSMGACIATLFASEHPECVAGLVLLAPSGLMKLKRFSGIWALRTFVRHVPPLSDYFKQKVGKNKTRVHAKALEKSGDFVNAESEEARSTALQIARQHIHNVNAWTAFWKCLCLFPLSKLKPAVQTIASLSSLNILLLAGALDPTTPPQENYRQWLSILSAHPCLEHSLIEGGAHSFFIERSSAVHPLIAQWLARWT